MRPQITTRPVPAYAAKELGLMKVERDKAVRMAIFKPKNTPRRQPKGDKTVGSISANDCGNRPEDEVCAPEASRQN